MESLGENAIYMHDHALSYAAEIVKNQGEQRVSSTQPRPITTLTSMPDRPRTMCEATKPHYDYASWPDNCKTEECENIPLHGVRNRMYTMPNRIYVFSST